MTVPIRLLIADDEEDMRLLMRVVFSRDDRFEVVGEAVDGRDAVDLCARLQPDALILDLRMPTMTGDEALPHIRRCSPDTAVVVFTAHATHHQAASVVASGAAAIVSKTTPPSVVADRVAEVLASE